MFAIQLAANYLKLCLHETSNNLSAECTGSLWVICGLEGQRLMQGGKVSSFQEWVKLMCHGEVNKLVQGTQER